MLENILKNTDLNINLDSDGILSYLLLKKYNNNYQIVGFNNSDKNIWSIHDKIKDVYKELFVDIFIPKNGVYCIDQHIVTRTDDDLNFFNTKEKINPHLLLEKHHALNNNYITKFPFQTFLFLLASIEKENSNIFKDLNFHSFLPNIGNNITFMDIILRADGVLENYVYYKKNICYWSKILSDYSNNGVITLQILSYLFSLSDDEALTKSKCISDFYTSYELSKDGGYNTKLDFEKNIQTINKFMKSCSKHFGLDLIKTPKKLYEYKGKKYIYEGDVLSIIDLMKLNTYAFIGKNKLSCTTDIQLKKTLNNIIIYS